MQIVIDLKGGMVRRIVWYVGMYLWYRKTRMGKEAEYMQSVVYSVGRLECRTVVAEQGEDFRNDEGATDRDWVIPCRIY